MKKFKGVITALITPFYQGKVDYDSLAKLVDFQIKKGIEGFVINGTTAESPALSEEEVEKIFHFVKARVAKDFPLIVGTGSNSTEKTIAASQAAERMGADGILVVVPYYNKPPQRGLFEHFKQVASAVSIPTILYNVPSRTITALELDTVKKLSAHPTIVGIKEASGNIDFAKALRQQCGETFLLLSGDDGTYDEFKKTGGDGVISVVSHIIPEAMLQVKATENLELINMLFCEANPMPVKMALFLMGIIRSPECRLPLVTMAEEKVPALKKLLVQKGLCS